MSADERAAAVAAALGSLSGLSLQALRQEWRRRWGEPPRFRSSDLLLRAIAYRLQAAQFGDLSKARAAEVRSLAARFTADRRFTPTPGPGIKPGTTLVRDWGGVRHVVTVTAEGFAYDGRAFASLSKVAQHISGVKRNGPAFFGLRSGS